jgi:adenylate cyclase
MWDDVWPSIAYDCLKGLLAGGAVLAIQWAANTARDVVGRLRARRNAVAVGAGEDTTRHQGVERRLSAILVADVVGYSRLTQVDEEGTHDRLTMLRREVIEPIIREHRGRIVKNIGDGALVEFGSVVTAVRCAIEVQRVLAVRNNGVPPDHRLELRVGVNLADVIVEPNDIYGDGVNIAVRLEGLAAPGGICLTADTWRYARGKISARVVDLGEQRLKNIAEPVHVYAIAQQMNVV